MDNNCSTKWPKYLPYSFPGIYCCHIFSVLSSLQLTSRVPVRSRSAAHTVESCDATQHDTTQRVTNIKMVILKYRLVLNCLSTFNVNIIYELSYIIHRKHVNSKLHKHESFQLDYLIDQPACLLVTFSVK